MNKSIVERFFIKTIRPVESGGSLAVFHTEDVGRMEENLNDAVKLITKTLLDIEVLEKTAINAPAMFQDLKDDYIKIVERATGLTWQEIKQRL